jgi:holo-[acyl-carrier protein] synthase
VIGAAGPGTVAGIGLDAVDIVRFRKVITRRPRLVERVFTEEERAYANRQGEPAQHLAVRLAAKEAVMKTLGVGIGGFAMRDVEVVRAVGPSERRGAPTLQLTGRAAELARRRGIVKWHVSLTHTDELALAVVLGESGPGAG